MLANRVRSEICIFWEHRHSPQLQNIKAFHMFTLGGREMATFKRKQEQKRMKNFPIFPEEASEESFLSSNTTSSATYSGGFERPLQTGMNSSDLWKWFVISALFSQLVDELKRGKMNWHGHQHCSKGAETRATQTLTKLEALQLSHMGINKNPISLAFHSIPQSRSCPRSDGH